MNVLVIGITSPPKNSPESIQTGRYLRQIARDNHVTLVCGKVIGGWEPYDTSLLKYTSDVKAVVVLKSLPHRFIRILKSLAPSIVFPDDEFWTTKQVNYVKRKVQVEPQVIISRALPHSSTLLAKKLVDHWNVPWVMHLSDPWADNPFLKAPFSIKRRHEELEKNCISTATVVTLTSEKAVTHYSQKYPEFHKKFVWMPNVFDDDDVNYAPIDFEAKLSFVFTGRLYGERTVQPLVKSIQSAAEITPQFYDAEFIFAGFFQEKDIDCIRNSGLKNVRYIGSVSQVEAMRLQRSATILISIDAITTQDSRYELFFPSKLLDYLAAQRPIIAITGNRSTTFNVVQDNFGWCFDTNSLTDLHSLLITIMRHYKARDADFFSIKSSISKFSASANGKRLQEIIQKVALD